MAASNFTITNLASHEFVESAGAVLFHLPTQRVCILYYKSKNEWLLAKGRRSYSESRATAAIREVGEETGYKCSLYPVTLLTRAPPPDDEDVDLPDIPRSMTGSTEPFMLTIREQDDKDTKLIWWFIAAIDSDQIVLDHKPSPEEMFDVGMFSYAEAVQKLKYQADREIILKAISIVEATSRTAVERALVCIA